MIVSVEEVAREIGWPSEEWKNNCHAVSVQAVRSGLLGTPGPTCRVVRGWAVGYGIDTQHSWIAMGHPYDPETEIVDLTAHCWGEVLGAVHTTVGQAYRGAYAYSRGHLPHGYKPGSIFEYGRPDPVGELVELPRHGLSEMAGAFLDVLGPLSYQGWADLVEYPHGGWPAQEICEAIVDRLPRAAAYIPIDVVGHATDRNPDGLYW